MVIGQLLLPTVRRDQIESRKLDVLREDKIWHYNY